MERDKVDELRGCASIERCHRQIERHEFHASSRGSCKCCLPRLESPSIGCHGERCLNLALANLKLDLHHKDVFVERDISIASHYHETSGGVLVALGKPRDAFKESNPREDALVWKLYTFNADLNNGDF